MKVIIISYPCIISLLTFHSLGSTSYTNIWVVSFFQVVVIFRGGCEGTTNNENNGSEAAICRGRTDDFSGCLNVIVEGGIAEFKQLSVTVLLLHLSVVLCSIVIKKYLFKKLLLPPKYL